VISCYIDVFVFDVWSLISIHAFILEGLLEKVQGSRV